MKRLAIIILGGLALLGTTTSCQKDFEEINTNPNRPQQALPTGTSYSIVQWIYETLPQEYS